MSGRPKLKIFDPVIRPVSVTMVDRFVVRQAAPQALFHHGSVFEHPPAAFTSCPHFANVYVPIGPQASVFEAG